MIYVHCLVHNAAASVMEW